MRRKTFVSLFLLSILFKSISQVDTVYFNEAWHEISKEKASFYRCIKKETNLYLVEDFYRNKTLQMTGSFTSLNPELYEGYFKYYSEAGILIKEGEYKQNIEEGEWKLYYEDGKPLREENYLHGKLNGSLKGYYKNRQLRREEDYKNGRLVKGKCYTFSGKDTSFFSSYQTPEFAGGYIALKKYLEDNVKYPKDAQTENMEGDVFIKFEVMASGTIEHVEIQKGMYPSLDSEALRVVEHMPDWKPGKKNDMPVAVYFNIPISFKPNVSVKEEKKK
jgi:TonB family protein